MLAGEWDALRLAGQHEEAARIRDRLMDEYPQSLATMHLQERSTDSGAGPVLAAAGIDSQQIDETDPSGRLTLQMAAFADRSRALAYFETWHDRLPELRIDEEAGDEGVPLYKVRTGQYASRGQARNAAEELRQAHGLTQKQLAGRIGVSRQTIIALERGKQTPSITLALKLADELATPVEVIFCLDKSGMTDQSERHGEAPVNSAGQAGLK